MVRPMVPPRGVLKVSLARKAAHEEHNSEECNSARQLKRDEQSSRHVERREMKDRPGRSFRRWGGAGELAMQHSEPNQRYLPATAHFDFRHLLKRQVPNARLSARRGDGMQVESSKREEGFNARLQVTRREIAYRAVGRPPEVREVEVVKATKLKQLDGGVRDLSFVLKNKIGPPSKRESKVLPTPSRMPGCSGCQLASITSKSTQPEHERQHVTVPRRESPRGSNGRRGITKKISWPTPLRRAQEMADRGRTFWETTAQSVSNQPLLYEQRHRLRCLLCFASEQRPKSAPPPISGSATAARRAEGLAEEQAIKSAISRRTATAARREQGHAEEQAIRAAVRRASSPSEAASAFPSSPPSAPASAPAVRQLLVRVQLEPRVVAAGGRMAIVARPRVVESAEAWEQRPALAKLVSVTRHWAEELVWSASDLLGGVPEGKPFVDLVAAQLRIEWEEVLRSRGQQALLPKPLIYSAPGGSPRTASVHAGRVASSNKSLHPEHRPSKKVPLLQLADQAHTRTNFPKQQPKGAVVVKQAPMSKPFASHMAHKQPPSYVPSTEGQPAEVPIRAAICKDSYTSHISVKASAINKEPSSQLIVDRSWLASLPSSSSEAEGEFQVVFGLPFLCADLWREMSKLGAPLGIDPKDVSYSFDTPGINASDSTMLGISRTATFENRGFTRCECVDVIEGSRVEWLQLDSRKTGVQFLGAKDIDPTFSFELTEGMPGGAAGSTIVLKYTFSTIDLGRPDISSQLAVQLLREHLQRSAPEAFARDMIIRGYDRL